MYQAKSFGRNRFVIFNESMRSQMLQELGQEQALQQAVQQRQFQAQLRPLVAGATGELVGYQARLHWLQADEEQQQELSRQAVQAGLMPDVELALLQQLTQQPNQA